MNKLADNLRALIIKNEISEFELARRIGVAQPIINRLVKAQTASPKVETLIKIANYFAITVGELIGQFPLDETMVNESSLLHRGWSKIKLLEWDEIIDYQNHKAMASKERYVLTDIEPDESLYALILHGSVMEPKFPKGSVLICSTMYSFSDGDSIIVHFHNQDVPVVRLVIVDNNKTYLSTINTKIQDVTELSSNDKVLGVVVQVRLDMPTRKEK